MPVYAVEDDIPVIIAEVDIVFYRHFNGIIYLHIHIVPAAPVPVPATTVGIEDGFGGNQAGVAFEFHNNFVEFVLYFFLVVPAGLYMHLYQHPVFVPGSKRKVAITVADLQQGIRFNVELFFNGFLLGIPAIHFPVIGS